MGTTLLGGLRIIALILPGQKRKDVRVYGAPIPEAQRAEIERGIRQSIECLKREPTE